MRPTVAERVPHALLVREVRERMQPRDGDERRLTVGAEVELIPLRRDGRARVPLRDGPEGPGTLTLLRVAGGARSWTLEPTAAGVPRVSVPCVGWITFEPGGQIELSTLPITSVDGVIQAVEDVLRPLHEAAERLGIEWVARGIDPVNEADSAPLLVSSERYRKQSAHYAALGPWGRRMMRQSAAIHVNLDLGGRAPLRWSVANRAAPFVTALFANSPRYGGAETGLRSFRAEQWRHLDPSRSGLLPEEGDPAAAYTAFALSAMDFLGPPEGAPPRSFRESWRAGAGLDAWRDHLTTLFPEVRPRGYLEIRSVDALRAAWAPVPFVVLAGLLYDPDALAEAGEALPRPSAETLLVAGRAGLQDPDVRSGATAVFELGLRGARSLGPDVVGGALLERAEEFRRRFLDRGLDPGHEADREDPFEV